MADRQILHIDMDAFFAAVELRDHPELADLPVVVGRLHRGVVAAASYAARSFGIHSAMSMAQAVKRCPQVVVVAPRYERYSEVSAQIFAIFRAYTPLVEGLSLDEAFLDVSESFRLFGPGAVIARAVVERIRNEVGLDASCGVAPNKFVAKIASDLRKPRGFVVVTPQEVKDFLAPLPVERIGGVGKVAASRLHGLGYNSLGDLAAASSATVQQFLGEWGVKMRELAMGNDTRPVESSRVGKSVSGEATFAEDVDDILVLRRALLRQALRVASRLQAGPTCGKTVFVKIKYADFSVQTRRLTLREPVFDADSIYEAGCQLLERFKGLAHGVRLCGMGVTDLQPGAPPRGLFVDSAKERRQALERVRHQLTERFGDAALTRAALLEDF